MNPLMSFVGGAVGVTEEEPVGAVGRSPGQDVDEVEAFAVALKVEADGGIEAEVVITEDHGELRVDRAEFVEDRFLANVAEVPDFIDVPEELRHPRNPAIMGVGDDADAVVL
jgi:hypothetical protein